jgi:hypothetical protein
MNLLTREAALNLPLNLSKPSENPLLLETSHRNNMLSNMESGIDARFVVKIFHSDKESGDINRRSTSQIIVLIVLLFAGVDFIY